MEHLVAYISERLDEQIVASKPVSGGSISAAYRLNTPTRSYFLKVNQGASALKMFHAEQKGLQAIEETGTIAVPHVHLVDSANGRTFLLMDHVESKRPEASDYLRLGMGLAQLHQTVHSKFGFTDDNFIGSLPQSNRARSNWPEFYWLERIWPQLELALQRDSWLKR